MFRYVYEADGQWTIIRCRSLINETSLYRSLAVADDRLLLSCALASLLLSLTVKTFMFFPISFLIHNNSLICHNLGKCGSIYAGINCFSRIGKCLLRSFYARLNNTAIEFFFYQGNCEIHFAPMPTTCERNITDLAFI